MKHIVLVVFLVSLLLYLTKDGQNTTGFVVARPNLEKTDQLLSLQAEIGYLRKKLAKCSNPVTGILANSKIEHFKPIYVITPTYTRPVQKAELTRLATVFVMVPNLHWIVVEDARHKTNLVSGFLQSSGLNYTHLYVETPEDMKLKPKDPHWSKPRGVFQRNEALAWLRNNFKVGEAGVVYFADDDNAYSVELFEEISGTEKVSVFPVGLVGGVLLERPAVSGSDGSSVVGWSVGWATDRPFATDMAGFAINLSYLLSHTSAKFASTVKIGYQETEFLKHLVHLEDLEPVSSGRVLVWHTRTEKPNLNKEKYFHDTHGHSSDQGHQV